MLKVSPSKVPLKVTEFLSTCKGSVSYEGSEFDAINRSLEYFFLYVLITFD